MYSEPVLKERPCVRALGQKRVNGKGDASIFSCQIEDASANRAECRLHRGLVATLSVEGKGCGGDKRRGASRVGLAANSRLAPQCLGSGGQAG